MLTAKDWARWLKSHCENCGEDISASDRENYKRCRRRHAVVPLTDLDILKVIETAQAAKIGPKEWAWHYLNTSGFGNGFASWKFTVYDEDNREIGDFTETDAQMISLIPELYNSITKLIKHLEPNQNDRIEVQRIIDLIDAARE